MGWTAYVSEIGHVYRALTPTDRSHTALVASNYGEAGAIDRYGGADGLPRVFSAQNQLYYQGRPPARDTIALIAGGQADETRRLFAKCRTAGSLDNRAQVDNEEQGQPIIVCRDPIGGWRRVWPQLKHRD